MLAELLAPLDYPRQSAYNLARSGGRLISGEAYWGDLRRALPAGAGIAAGLLGGPLVGLGVAGALQGLGSAFDPEGHRAPGAADLVEALGGDRESFLQTALAQVATDPLTYGGALGAASYGRGLLAKNARLRPRLPGEVPATPPGAFHYPPPVAGPQVAYEAAPFEAAAPRAPAAGVPFGTDDYYAGVQKALEADAAAQAGAEQKAALRTFQPPAAGGGGPLTPEAGPGQWSRLDPLSDYVTDARQAPSLRGVYADMTQDAAGRPATLETLLQEMGLGNELANAELGVARQTGSFAATPALIRIRNQQAAARRLAGGMDDDGNVLLRGLGGLSDGLTNKAAYEQLDAIHKLGLGSDVATSILLRTGGGPPPSAVRSAASSKGCWSPRSSGRSWPGWRNWACPPTPPWPGRSTAGPWKSGWRRRWPTCSGRSTASRAPEAPTTTWAIT